MSLISQETRANLFPNVTLEKPRVRLSTYTAEPIGVVGQFKVQVRHKDYIGEHDLYVVKGDGPSLIGRDWLTQIKLDWASVRQIASDETQSKVEELVGKYPTVFQSGIGAMRDFKANLVLKPDAIPRFCRPRSMPYAIKEQVSKELDRLEGIGVLRKVSHSEWASPLVPVPKRDGSIRLCGDFKVSLNPFLKVEQYPLPTPADLFACLTGGKRFSKLDLTAAYQQVVLDPDSAKLVTINTHKGLYACDRLPFGVASAPALFQRIMDTVLQGIPKSICYIDDILVTGSTDAEHLKHLEEVLTRLQKYGIRLKREKCVFLQDSVEYLGHRVDARGIHTSKKKVQAILEAPVPKNLPEFRSFLGLLNYYAKFIPNLASVLHPLHRLLRVGQPWQWSKDCKTAFESAKKSLSQSPVLVHYDPNLPIVLAADASAYGVGAVISHRQSDGTDQPIAYASRTLTQSERNYAQIEREALSIIFGIKRFHKYLYGREFVLITDHKPLTTILGPKQGIPPLAAARMQRWALILSAYHYEIQFRPTKQHANADSLSRLPLVQQSSEGNAPDPTVFNLMQIASLPVRAQEVAEATRSDPMLNKLLGFIRTGWPQTVPDALIPFWRRKEELSVEGDCIIWGCRVVIPEKLQKIVLEELHVGHPGIVRMKLLARGHVWWPKLGKDIEQSTKSCMACQGVKRLPPKAPLHSWAWPTVPWERVHVDFGGPIFGKMLLLVVDSHSKWPEVIPMSSTTAEKTIAVLLDLFSRFGVPRQLVSDNGPQFTSAEFGKFLAENGVKHIRSAPYHPATNGAVERLVQTVKRALRTSHDAGIPFEQSLASFLLRYRTTAHATTGVAPRTLMFGRDLRTRLHLLTPDLGGHVRAGQAKQKVYHDRHSCRRELRVGQSVWAKNFREGSPWVRAVISDKTGPVSYLVKLQNGDFWRRHVDHLREGSEQPPMEESAETIEDFPISHDESTESPAVCSPELPSTSDSNEISVPLATGENLPAVSDSNLTENRCTARYPSRSRKTPNRLYGTLQSV